MRKLSICAAATMLICVVWSTGIASWGHSIVPTADARASVDAASQMAVGGGGGVSGSSIYAAFVILLGFGGGCWIRWRDAKNSSSETPSSIPISSSLVDPAFESNLPTSEIHI